MLNKPLFLFYLSIFISSQTVIRDIEDVPLEYEISQWQETELEQELPESNPGVFNKKEYFYCEKCDKNILEIEEIDVSFHLANTHSVCYQCNRQFESFHKIHKHIRTAHISPKMMRSNLNTITSTINN